MTNKSFQQDVGAYLHGVNALNPAVVTATTVAAGTELDGVDINRLSDPVNLTVSAKVIIPYSYSLAAAETATLKSNAQDGASTTAYTDYDDKDGSTANSVTVGSTATTAAQTGNGVLEYDLDLAAARQYVRIQLTPTFSATSADTNDVGGVMVFGGGTVLPAA
ncbi:hypothetical protein LCGC14_0232140 [marine sediment metagenome]|uniref:Uncharacterized protein n=1 Tax=marine sediment metagenome TaxID=412755 RepID=A0A0F9WUR4_9ZZZZ